MLREDSCAAVRNYFPNFRLLSGLSAERGDGAVRMLNRHAVEIAAETPADVRDVLFAECGLLFGFLRVQTLGFGFMIKFVDSCNLCFGHIGFPSFLCLPACRQRCSVRLYHFLGILANPKNSDYFAEPPVLTSDMNIGYYGNNR